MQAAHSLSPGEVVGSADQRLVMHGVPWAHFEAILALRGDRPVPRMTYLRGALELMTPSQTHESIKTLLARMIEIYAQEKRIRLSGFGSWTLRNAPSERAIEPDECYILGDRRGKDRPDLAVEVIWTSGGLDKLEVYRRLGVAEVWLWRAGAIRVFVLEGEGYAEVARSRLLPDLDIELVSRLSVYEDQSDAIDEFLTIIRRPNA